MILSKAIFILIVIYKITILTFYNALDINTHHHTNKKHCHQNSLNLLSKSTFENLSGGKQVTQTFVVWKPHLVFFSKTKIKKCVRKTFHNHVKLIVQTHIHGYRKILRMISDVVLFIAIYCSSQHIIYFSEFYELLNIVVTWLSPILRCTTALLVHSSTVRQFCPAALSYRCEKWMGRPTIYHIPMYSALGWLVNFGSRGLPLLVTT
jgi:hypothetical protein